MLYHVFLLLTLSVNDAHTHDSKQKQHCQPTIRLYLHSDLHFIAHAIYIVCIFVANYHVRCSTFTDPQIRTVCPHFYPFAIKFIRIVCECACVCAFHAYIKSELLQAMHLNAKFSFQFLAHIIYIMFCLAKTCRKFNQNLLNLLFYIFPLFSLLFLPSNVCLRLLLNASVSMYVQQLTRYKTFTFHIIHKLSLS